MSSKVVSGLASPLWRQVSQPSRRMCASVSEATSAKASNGESGWQTIAKAVKDAGPGIVLTGVTGTAGYLCVLEISHIDSNISRIDNNISHIDSKIDDTAKTINERIDQTHARIDDTAKTINARIEGLTEQMVENNKSINTRIADETRAINARIDQTNARIDDTAKTINARIDNLGDKFDQLKDAIVQHNQRRSFPWWW